MNINSDIVCLGDIMIEYILKVPSLPSKDVTLILDSISQELGGPAFNICWYLSQLGLKPRLVGTFGKRNKQLVNESISSAKLDDSRLISIEGDTDVLISFLINQHYHSIYLRTNLPKEVGLKLLANCDKSKKLILTGSRHSIIRRTFLTLAETFEFEYLVFNPSYAIYEYSEGELAEILQKVHIVILNRQEAEYSCEILNFKNFNQLYDYLPGSLILTLGEEGVRVYHEGETLELGSLATKTSNVIGAGDAFLAGFLFKIFSGTTFDNAAQFGSKLAAYVIESPKVRVRLNEEVIKET